MTIEEALKREALDVRLTYGDRWMVWWFNEWLVLERKPYAKKNKTLYRGKNLEDALDALIEQRQTDNEYND